MTSRFAGASRRVRPVHRVRAWLGLFVLALALLPQAVSADCDGRVYGTGGEGVWLKEAPDLEAWRIKVLPEDSPV